MRLDRPRLAPLADAELSPEQAALIEDFKARGADYNIFRTFVRDPAALRARAGELARTVADNAPLTLPGPNCRAISPRPSCWRCSSPSASTRWSRCS